MRIVSLLPSATEILFALGFDKEIVGVSHECDFPPHARTKKVVIHSRIPKDAAPAEIDRLVREFVERGESLYSVDTQALDALQPDLIITQDLCQVCAPSGNEISQLLTSLPSKPQILWLTPKSLEQIFDNLRELGEATGRSEMADTLITEGRVRLAKIEAATRVLVSRPRVFCMEWMDPVYCCGHWVPEMVRIAGGFDKLGREGADSVRIRWDDVLEWKPEVLIVMPCGFDLEKTFKESQRLTAYPGWDDLPAVRNGRVYAVDANSYFARPGPRVVEGTELLAHLLHPELFEWKGPANAFRRLI